MKISELILELNKYPQDMRVFIESDTAFDIAGGVQKLDPLFNSIIIRHSYGYCREPEKFREL